MTRKANAQAAEPQVPADQTANQTAEQTPPANVYEGLRRAQTMVSHAAKDGRNKHHDYAYATAESMIASCRTALANAGVVARRRSWRVSEDGLFVLSVFEVSLGATGETLTDSDIPWPIVVERGKPADKAIASALTTSLSYWLRDLLLLPREEDADMDKRNDKANPTTHGIPTGRRNADDLNAEIRSARSAPQRKPDAPAEPAKELRGWLHGLSERKSPDGRVFTVATVESGGVSREMVMSAMVEGYDAKARDMWQNSPVVVGYLDRGERMPVVVSLKYDDTAPNQTTPAALEGTDNVLF